MGVFGVKFNPAKPARNNKLADHISGGVTTTLALRTMRLLNS